MGEIGGTGEDALPVRLEVSVVVWKGFGVGVKIGEEPFIGRSETGVRFADEELEKNGKPEVCEEVERFVWDSEVEEDSESFPGGNSEEPMGFCNDDIDVMFPRKDEVLPVRISDPDTITAVEEIFPVSVIPDVPLPVTLPITGEEVVL